MYNEEKEEKFRTPLASSPAGIKPGSERFSRLQTPMLSAVVMFFLVMGVGASLIWSLRPPIESALVDFVSGEVSRMDPLRPRDLSQLDRNSPLTFETKYDRVKSTDARNSTHARAMRRTYSMELNPTLSQMRPGVGADILAVDFRYPASDYLNKTPENNVYAILQLGGVGTEKTGGKGPVMLSPDGHLVVPFGISVDPSNLGFTGDQLRADLELSIQALGADAHCQWVATRSIQDLVGRIDIFTIPLQSFRLEPRYPMSEKCYVNGATHDKRLGTSFLTLLQWKVYFYTKNKAPRDFDASAFLRGSMFLQSPTVVNKGSSPTPWTTWLVLILVSAVMAMSTAVWMKREQRIAMESGTRELVSELLKAMPPGTSAASADGIRTTIETVGAEALARLEKKAGSRIASVAKAAIDRILNPTREPMDQKTMASLLLLQSKEFNVYWNAKVEEAGKFFERANRIRWDQILESSKADGKRKAILWFIAVPEGPIGVLYDGTLALVGGDKPTPVEPSVDEIQERVDTSATGSKPQQFWMMVYFLICQSSSHRRERFWSNIGHDKYIRFLPECCVHRNFGSKELIIDTCTLSRTRPQSKWHYAIPNPIEEILPNNIVGIKYLESGKSKRRQPASPLVRMDKHRTEVYTDFPMAVAIPKGHGILKPFTVHSCTQEANERGPFPVFPPKSMFSRQA